MDYKTNSLKIFDLAPLSNSFQITMCMPGVMERTGVWVLGSLISEKDQTTSLCLFLDRYLGHCTLYRISLLDTGIAYWLLVRDEQKKRSKAQEMLSPRLPNFFLSSPYINCLWQHFQLVWSFSKVKKVMRVCGALDFVVVVVVIIIYIQKLILARTSILIVLLFLPTNLKVRGGILVHGNWRSTVCL